jgi:hypothetical protein
MGTTSMRRSAVPLELARRVDWAAVGVWSICFALVAYLGLKGGGYDPLVHDQVGIAVWWLLLVGVLAGAFPRLRPGGLGWAALGLLAALVVWTGLSLIWTESPDKTSADLARLAGYLGVFCLAIFMRGARAPRRIAGAVASAIVLVAAVALLSRFHPAWFPAADQTARFLASDRERLSYPLNYWNALAGLIAIGAPLVLGGAVSARSALLRAAAAAALPALALAAFFTLSRGGIAAAVLALVVFLAFAGDPLPKLLALVPAGAGAAVLIVLAVGKDALRHGLPNSTAHHQGSEMLAITLLVCLGVGATFAFGERALRGVERPGWTSVARRQALVAAVAALLVLAVAAVALDAPGRLSNAWAEFKQSDVGPGHGATRLSSAAGESRYQFWSVAVDENSAKPLTGTGSGTFEYWWARDGDGSGSVRDAHSLYMQTLAELGIVGLVLLVALLLAILVGGGRNVLRSRRPERTTLAAALAGCLAFCLTAAFDWLWQIPAIPAATLLLAAILVTAAGRLPGAEGDERLELSLSRRLAFAAASAVAIVLIAIPLAATTQVRQSEADFRQGDLSAALRAARTARNVQPGAAAPRLQEALVLETRGELAAAAAAARAAAERESTNWRNFLVLSRIEAERGEAVAAVRDYRRARSLNPNSELFER